MATRTHARLRSRRSLLAVIASLALAGGATLVPTAVHADPPPTLSQVQARIDALNARLDRVVESYDQAKIDLTSARHRASQASAEVAAAKARLGAVRAQISSVAAAAYRGGNTGSFVALMGGGDPQQLVDRAAALDHLDRGAAARLATVTAAEHDLAAKQRTATQAVDAADQLETTIAGQKADIQQALDQQKHLYDSLSAKQRARLAAAKRAAAAHQRALAASGASRYASVYSGSAGSASGSAAVAVAWAYRELGKPYAWGAGGPGAFDCSGLTSYVWAKAGVSLPHSSGAQFGSGAHVSRSDLRPGDLVFFGSPIHHVGIYVGGGQMIEAPHSGADVRVASIDRYDYAGAVRP